MEDNTYEAVQAACGLIKAINDRGRVRQGTGYLVAANRVATCLHVIKDARNGGSLSIEFQDGVYAATELKSNESDDCALLELTKSPEGVEPLALAGRCGFKVAWDGYGFPVVAREAGTFLDGIVSHPNGRDDKKRSVLHLWARQIASGMGTPLGGFSGSPVMVNGCVAGQLKKIIPDPERSPDPDIPPRPALGLVYATPSSVVLQLMEAEPTCPNIEAPKPGSPAAVAGTEKVLALFKNWIDAGMPRGPAALLVAESLIQLGSPDQALKVLEDASKGVRTEQLRALALAKTKEKGKVDEAIKILVRLRRAGHLDAETGGILAGRYKQKWEASGDPKHLEEAFKIYRDTFKLSRDTYPGINASAMALQLNKRADSKRLAQQVLGQLRDTNPEEMGHWDLATVGEAHLLLKDLEKAKEWYAKAIAHYPEAKEIIARMQSQAQFNLKALGLPEDALDESFVIPHCID